MTAQQVVPQLRMIHELGRLPLQPDLPAGYGLRKARADDAASIARTLHVAFAEPWSAERVEEELLADSEVRVTLVIEHQGTAVGTASYQEKGSFPRSSWVHWLGVDPEHRGRWLGRCLVYAVLEESKRRQQDSCLLLTDDFRLEAIKTYSRLGFEPLLSHVSHRARWDAVMIALGVGMPIRAHTVIGDEPPFKETSP